MTAAEELVTSGDGIPLVPPSTPPIPKCKQLQFVWPDACSSGISNDVMEARGYSIVFTQGEAREYGFSHKQARRVSDDRHEPAHALLVPLWGVEDRDTEKPSGYQLRPTRPPLNGDGRKYENQPGAPLVLDTNPLMWDKVVKLATEVWVTEGAKKVDALATIGIPAIGLQGVTCWVGKEQPGKKDSESRPLPGWDVIEFSDRHFIICFDSDAATKPEVQRELSKLAAYLVFRGVKKVSKCVLPHGPDGKKWGVDDYLAAGHTSTDLVRLLTEVKPTRSEVKRWEDRQQQEDAGAEHVETVREERASGIKTLLFGPEKLGCDFVNAADALPWLRSNLGGRALPGFYLREDSLVRTPRVGEDGYVDYTEDKAEEGWDDGPAQVRHADPETVAGVIDNTYAVIKVKYDPESGRVKRAPMLWPLSPTSRVVKTVVENDRVPRLAGVTHTPLLRRNGTLLQEPGYDHVSRLLFLPEPGRKWHLRVPDTVDDDAVTWAVGIINDFLVDFPFITPTDKANYIALGLLTPILRLVAPPPYPMLALDAHQPGSGKTKLAEIAGTLHGWVQRPEIPPDAEEQRKQFMSTLLTTTAPIVVWDNLTYTLRTGQLSNLLTAQAWDDRELGKNNRSSGLRARNDRIWVVTGNNITLGGDMPRRVYVSSIDPKVPEPQKRTGFRHIDVVGYVRTHRETIITALLVIARAWVQRESTPTLFRTDSYGWWSAVLAEMLEVFVEDDDGTHLGGPFRNQSTADTKPSAEDEELGALLEALSARFGSTPFTVPDAMAYLHSSEAPDGVIPPHVAERIGSETKQMGIYLSRRAGRYGVGGFRVDKHDARRPQRWVVTHHA